MKPLWTAYVFLFSNITGYAQKKPNEPMPYHSVLIDENDRQVYRRQNTQPYVGKTDTLELEVNNLTLPPQARVDAYDNYMLKQLNMSVLPQTPLGDFFLLPFVPKSGNLWPPKIPLSISKLGEKNTLFTVFTVKAFEKLNYLDKIDLWQFKDGKTTRSYWSRDLNDPRRLETASQAIKRVVTHFQRNLNFTMDLVQQEPCKIVMDKDIPDKELLLIEDFVRAIGGKDTLALAPSGVSSESITWSAPLSKAQCGQLGNRLLQELSSARIKSDNQVIRVQTRKAI